MKAKEGGEVVILGDESERRNESALTNNTQYNVGSSGIQTIWKQSRKHYSIIIMDDYNYYYNNIIFIHNIGVS